MKATVPVGTLLPVVAETVAVKVTKEPVAAAMLLDFSAVVVATTGRTVTETVADVLAVKVESPP